MNPAMFLTLAQIIQFLYAVKSHFSDEEFDRAINLANKYWNEKEELDKTQYWQAFLDLFRKISMAARKEAIKKIGLKWMD